MPKTKRKRNFPLIFLMIIGVLAGIAFLIKPLVRTSVQAAFDPQIDSLAVIMPIDSDTAYIYLSLSVYNPLWWDIEVKEFPVEIRHKDDLLLSGWLKKPVTVNSTSYGVLIVEGHGLTNILGMAMEEESLTGENIVLQINSNPVLSMPLLGNVFIDISTRQTIDPEDPPRVEINELNANIIGEEYFVAHADFRIEVMDLLPKGTLISKVNFEIMHEDDLFIKGVKDDFTELQEGFTTVIIPGQIMLSEVFEQIRAMQHRDSVVLDITAYAELISPQDMIQKIYIEASQRILVPIPLEILIKSVTITEMEHDSTYVEIVLDVTNHNEFGLTIHGYHIILNINDKNWVNDKHVRHIEVGGKTQMNIALQLAVNTSEIGRAAVNVMVGRTGFDFDFTGDFDITTFSEALGRVNLVLHHKRSEDVEELIRGGRNR